MYKRQVLDLACGTGSLTCRLAERGYEMIGVDQSEEMLAVAAEKGRAVQGEKPIFLHQSMQELDLYGTIDACVCCLDSVNYVTRPADLRRAFQRVHLFLMPGGVFLFDVNTPEKLRNLDGQMFMDETDDTYCVWRAEYSARRRICTYGMDPVSYTHLYSCLRLPQTWTALWWGCPMECAAYISSSAPIC